MKKRYITWEEIFYQLNNILLKITDIKGIKIYGVPKGGMIVAGFLKHQNIESTPFVEEAHFILDDLIDSGNTKKYYEEKYSNKPFLALFDKKELQTDDWFVFPWEAEHPGKEDSIQENIVRQLEYIGEDPNREGLIDTPNRIVKAWDELFSGYQKDPADLLTTFTVDGYDQMVVLKDIELFSMCEHHMLPFFGKAHVAYIPGSKVIGISKLARLVDIYARRLQIQERLGEQVTTALMEYLQPQGAACIIEAVHMCMRMRGCTKQHSTMITSSLKGVFLHQSEARAELLQLIK